MADEMPKRLMTITVERGTHDFFYAMVDNGPPMLIGAETGVPDVLRNMAACIDHMVLHHPSRDYMELVNTD